MNYEVLALKKEIQAIRKEYDEVLLDYANLVKDLVTKKEERDNTPLKNPNQNMNLQIFKYNNQDVSFDFGEDTKMINATQMAKAFPSKEPSNFLRTAQTKAYIDALSRSVNLQFGEIVKTVKGGNDRNSQGTWMHEKLALKFAAYLSPEFELWVYERIHELLTTGKTEIAQPKMTQMQMLQQMVNGMVEQEQRTLALESTQSAQAEKINELEAKITTRNENYFTVAGYAALMGHKITMKTTQEFGRKATTLSKARDIPKSKVYDARFGLVGSYHRYILEEIFKEL